MSAIQPIPQIVLAFGHPHAIIVEALRPEANGFGRKTGWIKATNARIPVSRTNLRALKDQGFTKVKVRAVDDNPVIASARFTIEELLA